MDLHTPWGSLLALAAVLVLADRKSVV